MSTNTAPELLTGVRDVVAVHSAKGGVGKSTVTTNLAAAWTDLGLRVGVLDADVHGPSIAHMFGSSERPRISERANQVSPIERHGVHYLSLANVATPDAPIIWRGPMVSGALQQLLTQVDWGELDVLLLDMPPGTGDAVLGIGQTITLSGVVVVTTPQELSVADSRRGMQAFAALQVPALGLIENLSLFTCDGCGDRVALFGEGAGRAAAEELGIPFLGRIPIQPNVARGGDAGVPVVITEPQSEASLAFTAAAREITAQLALRRTSPGSFDLTWEKRSDFRREPPGTAPVPTGDSTVPVAVWQAADDVLGIRWGDGATTFHGAYELRTACPCASCVEEWTRERLPSLDAVPRNVRPVTIHSVGRYALQPVWSDGHRTGIFAFRELRAGAGAVDPR